jgi:hypothetical protein
MTGYVCDYSKLICAWFGEPVTDTVECSALELDDKSLCYAAYNEKDRLCKTPVWLEREYVLGSGSDHAMAAMDMAPLLLRRWRWPKAGYEHGRVGSQLKSLASLTCYTLTCPVVPAAKSALSFDRGLRIPG